jgi:hypothetical protein
MQTNVHMNNILAKGAAALFVSTAMMVPVTEAAVIALDVPVNEALGYNPTQLYYNMNAIVSGSPNTTLDSSGNSNTGALHNGTQGVAPTSVAGKFGNAINFEGTTDIFDINPFLYASSSSSLQLTDMSFTMGVWLNFDSFKDGSYNVDVLSKGYQGGAAANPGYTFYLQKSSLEGMWSLNFETRDGTNLGETTTGLLQLDLEAGTWYHFGMSYDDLTGQVIYYFNGDSVGSYAQPVAIGASSDFLNLNERGVSTWNSWFDGAYDDVFVTSGVHAFTAVPEPSVAALALVGCAAALLRRGRRA